MQLLLAILSVLAAWAFLVVLVIGLLLIFKPLEGTLKSLEQIAMGVRAIERETGPLGGRLEKLSERLSRVDTLLKVANKRMEIAIEDIDSALSGRHHK